MIHQLQQANLDLQIDRKTASGIELECFFQVALAPVRIAAQQSKFDMKDHSGSSDMRPSSADMMLVSFFQQFFSLGIFSGDQIEAHKPIEMIAEHPEQLDAMLLILFFVK